MTGERITAAENPGRPCLRGWRQGMAGSATLEDCALIIPTYRRPVTLVGLLEHLTTLPDCPAEVVVVDGSPDRQVGEAVAAWTKTRELPFGLVYVSSPAGLTRQRNVGVDASTKEFLFFLDDDCIPQPGYFRAIRQVFAGDQDGRVGAVCGSIVNEMGKPVSLRWRIRFFLRLVPRGESGRYYPTATSVPRALVVPFTGTRPVDMVPGGASAYRREVFQSYRFSLFFDGYSQGEDLEMSMRIGKQWKLLWSGDARVLHQHAAGGRPASVQKGRMEIRNRYFIWKRYTPRPSLMCRIKLWLDFGYILGCDLAGWIAHPRETGVLHHALGVACGSAECLLSPPRYQEPPARREYDFSLEESANGAQTAPKATA